MNEQNAKKLEQKEETLKKVQENIDKKENTTFSSELEYLGNKYPNIFVIGTKEVLASEIKTHEEFIKIILAFKGNANAFDSKVSTVSVRNGKINVKWDWEEIKTLKILESFDEEARGQVFFYARALVLKEALEEEIETLKN